MNATDNTPSSPYGGNSVQMASPSTSGTMTPSSEQQQQPNLPSFQSPTSSSNNNNPSQNRITSINEVNDSSSVQKILNEILMNNQAHNTSGGGSMVGGHGSFVNDGKGGSNVNSSGVLLMNGQVNNNSNTSIGGADGFGVGMLQSMGMNINENSSSLMNEGVGIMVRGPNVQPDLGNQLLGAVHGYDNFQCDWNV
ncbi:unnamed protein product [Eruca vesicaria subsp. sativa]|uniref:Uncharacterized protein n=1 Tax=Eruca vesicaria subsp. sativa TaxID=29727 RepID=A0ABC8KCW5_ERUVS|nr:unnamed protein product [Eruca vesicaria subsp. sativa]